jgi:hypothetical protein
LPVDFARLRDFAGLSDEIRVDGRLIDPTIIVDPDQHLAR